MKSTEADADTMPLTDVPESMRPRSPARFDFESWRRVVSRTFVGVSQHNLSLVAAGVGFYSLLSVVPAIAVLVALYGLIAEPRSVVEVIDTLRSFVPADVYALIREELMRITGGEDAALTLGAVLGLGASLWSANQATKAMFTGLNVAYGESEQRGFIRLNLVSLPFTLAVVIGAGIVLFTVAGLPSVLGDTLPHPIGPLIRLAVLEAALLTLFGACYRFGPNRRKPRWAWISPGAVFGSIAWFAVSLLFSFYVENFANYNRTFGALGGIAIALTFMWLTAFVVLLGAELNAELEHETLADSTIGPDRKIGNRGAFVADDIPPGVRDELAQQT